MRRLSRLWLGVLVPLALGAVWLGPVGCATHGEHPSDTEHPSKQEHPSEGEHPAGVEHPRGTEHPAGTEHPR
jgi:hypothetical protein